MDLPVEPHGGVQSLEVVAFAGGKLTGVLLESGQVAGQHAVLGIIVGCLIEFKGLAVESPRRSLLAGVF